MLSGAVPWLRQGITLQAGRICPCPWQAVETRLISVREAVKILDKVKGNPAENRPRNYLQFITRFCSSVQASDVHIIKKDIEKLEKVQKAVKMIQRLKRTPYAETLEEFNLF